jgi:hypothetical protein
MRPKGQTMPNFLHRRALGAMLALTLCAATPWAAASVAGKTPAGVNYISGGASSSELVSLHAQRDTFSLWVVTTALKSGAYLADVKVTIRDAKKQVVFEQKLEGPWLFIDLPVGAYEVEASLNTETFKRRTTLRKGDNHQVFFQFNTGDEVSPDNVSPFPTTPYKK